MQISLRFKVHHLIPRSIVADLRCLCSTFRSSDAGVCNALCSKVPYRSNSRSSERNSNSNSDSDSDSESELPSSTSPPPFCTKPIKASTSTAQATMVSIRAVISDTTVVKAKFPLPGEIASLLTSMVALPVMALFFWQRLNQAKHKAFTAASCALLLVNTTPVVLRIRKAALTEGADVRRVVSLRLHSDRCHPYPGQDSGPVRLDNIGMQVGKRNVRKGELPSDISWQVSHCGSRAKPPPSSS